MPCIAGSMPRLVSQEAGRVFCSCPSAITVQCEKLIVPPPLFSKPCLRSTAPGINTLEAQGLLLQLAHQQPPKPNIMFCLITWLQAHGPARQRPGNKYQTTAPTDAAPFGNLP